MYYEIQHTTKFRYSAPISESVMEVRMQPRTEATQRGVRFSLHVSPRARVLSYIDPQGNSVSHFNLPAVHSRLTLTTEAVVEMLPTPVLPERLSESAWDGVDRATEHNEMWDWLLPSRFARPSDALIQFGQRLEVMRQADPLTVLRDLNTALYNAITYAPNTTTVDSPIEHALECGCGVCQDYAHIMITLVRGLGIPCRYVSGYLFHQTDNATPDRSAADATHAWVEAWLPEIGWIGFDPTNNLIAGERHIRVAIGRDYADVPPTRGVFKGMAESELSVAVSVTPTDAPPADSAPQYNSVYWQSHDQQPDAETQQMMQQQQ
jgi:transglutaminase-like putative cysteine protease